MAQSEALTVTLTSSACRGYVRTGWNWRHSLAGNPLSQSKHIVVFDTLIKQSTPEEVEAVLGFWFLPCSFFLRVNARFFQHTSLDIGITSIQPSYFLFLKSTYFPSWLSSHPSCTLHLFYGPSTSRLLSRLDPPFCSPSCYPRSALSDDI